jgi:hypothetical protein
VGAFEDELETLGGRVETYESGLLTEEATKTAIIMPFISRVLGYDVFDPAEVIPEFIADVGLKKGEKIDYALCRDDQVQILIEVKKISDVLDIKHASQLFRYFHTSSARIGILTNGREWQFFTDLDQPNVMDPKPFLQLDLLAIDPYALPELKKLTKSAFDVESVVAAAEELKYVGAIKREIAAEFESPSEELVRLLANRVYTGMLTQKVKDQFTKLSSKALRQFINDRVNDRLKSALQAPASAVPVSLPEDPEPLGGVEEDLRDGVETTVDEMEGFHIVRAIAVSEIPVSRITFRDTKSYFGVLIDDNNRKPVCRLHFNRRQRYIGLLDEDKVESRVPVDRIEDIYDHAEAIRAAVKRYR